MTIFTIMVKIYIEYITLCSVKLPVRQLLLLLLLLDYCPERKCKTAQVLFTQWYLHFCIVNFGNFKLHLTHASYRDAVTTSGKQQQGFLQSGLQV